MANENQPPKARTTMSAYCGCIKTQTTWTVQRQEENSVYFTDIIGFA